MYLRRTLSAAIFVCCFLTAPIAEAANHWALVVGINAYESRWPQLDKAVPDALAAAKALDAAGFKVKLLKERETTTRAAIRVEWIKMLEGAQKGDVVLFYFAGHGLELQGHNFLVPIDGKLIAVPNTQNLYDPDQVKSSSLDFQAMLEELAVRQEQTDVLGLFIIDACRENPFRWHGGVAATAETAGGDQGLGPVRPPREVFVMYSAGIGQRALDGIDENSVYAEFLLPMLKSPKLSLSELAQRIRHKVYLKAQEVGHMQTPAYYDQLGARFTLRGEALELPDDDNPAPNAPYQLTRGTVKDGGVIIECPFCPEMVAVKVGSFMMGSPKDDVGAPDDEQPQHTVTIARRFAIGKFEITNREWNQCVAEKGCEGKQDVADQRRELRPVTGTTWNDAQKYVAWLSKLTGKTYRLPSEAEWEYAARAGTATRYSFGDGANLKVLCLYANGADRSAGALVRVNMSCDDNFGREPAQRGSYLANNFGLHDMHGNVWEWVEDCWHETYTGNPPTDGTAWQGQGTTCGARVARGGSWRSGPAALRSAVRHAFPPGHERATLGFRVVRELGETE